MSLFLRLVVKVRRNKIMVISKAKDVIAFPFSPWYNYCEFDKKGMKRLESELPCQLQRK